MAADLDQAIPLLREAASLWPSGDPGHYQALVSLAGALRQQFLSCGQPQAVADEALAILGTALQECPPAHASRWYGLAQLAVLAIARNDHPSAVHALDDTLRAPTPQVTELGQVVVWIIRQIDLIRISHKDKQSLLRSCTATVQLIAVSTAFALDHPAQLRALLGSSGIGLRAFLIASDLDNIPRGLQELERARGVIWSQALDMRNPQLQRVPLHLAKELKQLIGAVQMDEPREMGLTSTNATFLEQDNVFYEQRSRLQLLLGEIRGLPGLGDFMRGPDGCALLSAASEHPVVLIVGTHTGCCAVILACPHAPPFTLPLLELDADTLSAFASAGWALSQRGSSRADVEDE